MDFPPAGSADKLLPTSIQKMNLLDTVSPIVVWLSDQKFGGVPMLSRTRRHFPVSSPRSQACISSCSPPVCCFAFPLWRRRLRDAFSAPSPIPAAPPWPAPRWSVTDVQRGTSRTLTTDESGAYAAPDLQPGTYKIHVEARGFKSVERANVQIEVATDVRADFSLSPAKSARPSPSPKKFRWSTPPPPLSAAHSATKRSTTFR